MQSCTDIGKQMSKTVNKISFKFCSPWWQQVLTLFTKIGGKVWNLTDCRLIGWHFADWKMKCIIHVICTQDKDSPITVWLVNKTKVLCIIQWNQLNKLSLYFAIVNCGWLSVQVYFCKLKELWHRCLPPINLEVNRKLFHPSTIFPT